MPAALGMCRSEDRADVTVTGARTQHLLGVTHSTPEAPTPWPLLRPLCQKESLGGGSAEALSGQGFPHTKPSPGPFLDHFWMGGLQSGSTRRSEPGALLTVGESGHHRGHLGYSKPTWGPRLRGTEFGSRGSSDAEKVPFFPFMASACQAVCLSVRAPCGWHYILIGGSPAVCPTSSPCTPRDGAEQWGPSVEASPGSSGGAQRSLRAGGCGQVRGRGRGLPASPPAAASPGCRAAGGAGDVSRVQIAALGPFPAPLRAVPAARQPSACSLLRPRLPTPPP